MGCSLVRALPARSVFAGSLVRLIALARVSVRPSRRVPLAVPAVGQDSQHAATAWFEACLDSLPPLGLGNRRTDDPQGFLAIGGKLAVPIRIRRPARAQQVRC